MERRIGVLTMVLAGASLAGCERPSPASEAVAQEPERATPVSQRAQLMDDVRHAIAVLHPTEGSFVRGLVRFDADGERVRVTAEVTGLEPGTRHGFHVHELGDCSAPDAESAGGHFDPDDAPHALPPGSPRHAGDLGNIEVDRLGDVAFDERFDHFSIAGEHAPVLGRGVIVHARPDTGRGETGEAGSRLACGVIGVARAEP